MTDKQTKNKYCFDTSVFVNAWRRNYRPKSFACLWDHLGELMKSGIIFVPEEVPKEIGVGTDDLVAWFKKYKSCITPTTLKQIELVKSMVNKYPLLSEYKSSKVYSADTFVVATAKTNNYIVVTEEIKDGNKDKPKIPVLCKENSVECCNLSTFFEIEKIIFDIRP